MPTVTKTIGTTGRDYSTLTAWEAALNGAAGGSGNDAVGECYDDSAFSEQFVINDNTPDSITLRAASGQEHDGTAGTGVRNVASANMEIMYIHGDQTKPVVIENFEYDGNGREPFDSFTAGMHVHGNGNVRLHRMLVHGVVGSSTLGVHFRLGATNGADKEVLQNSIVYDCTQVYATATATGIALGSASGPCSIYNCTVHDIRHAGATQDCSGITQADTTNEKIQNVICTGTSVGGSGTVLDFADSSPVNATWDHNASSDTSASGTGSIDSVVAADEYVSTTGGSEDLHLQETAQCVDAGTTLSATTDIALDIDGVTRSGTWDIGADEIPVVLEFATNSAGTAITTTLSTANYTPTSGTLGFALSGTTATVTGWTISGTTLTINTTNYLSRHETILINHDQSQSTIEDSGTPLDDVTNGAVSNNSTIDYIKIAAATTVTLTADRPVTGAIRIIVDGTNQSTSVLDCDGFQITGTVTGACEFSTFTLEDGGDATNPSIDLTHGVGGETYIHDTTFDATGALSFSLGGNGRVRIEDVHYMDTCLNTVNATAGDTVPCLTIAGQNGTGLQSFVKTSWFDKGPFVLEATVSTSEWVIEDTRITGLRGGIGTDSSLTNVSVRRCYLRGEHQIAWSQVGNLGGPFVIFEDSIIDNGHWVVRGFNGVMEDCVVLHASGHNHFELTGSDTTIRRTIIALNSEVDISIPMQVSVNVISEDENTLFDHCTFVENSSAPAFSLTDQGAVSDKIEIRNCLFWNWSTMGGANAIIDEGINDWCTENYNAFGLQDPATDPRSGAATGANSIVETADPTFGMTGFDNITDLFDPDELADGTITVAEALATIRGLVTPPIDSPLIGAASDGDTIGAVEGPVSSTVATLPLVNGGLVNLGLLRGGLIS